MKYKCGCTADGDNVANYCPIHGEAEDRSTVLLSSGVCEICHDTGWYGNNGPGRRGNREFTPCDCDPQLRAYRVLKRKSEIPNLLKDRPFNIKFF